MSNFQWLYRRNEDNRYPTASREFIWFKSMVKQETRLDKVLVLQKLLKEYHVCVQEVLDRNLFDHCLFCWDNLMWIGDNPSKLLTAS